MTDFSFFKKTPDDPIMIDDDQINLKHEQDVFAIPQTPSNKAQANL